MKVMSSSEERISDNTNEYLFPLIAVIYGAVFSYAMYIFSQIIITAYNEWDIKHFTTVLDSESLKEIVLFISITVYMIEDVGSIMKLGNLYPFKRTSRYTFEIFIALLYISTFSLLGANIYYCVMFFSAIVLLGAIWYNQFKEEYPNDPSNINRYAVIERDLHYGGAIFLFAQASIFIALDERSMTWYNVGAFVVILWAWMFFAARWICLRSGERVLRCRIMVFLPDHVVRKICSKQTTLT